MIFVWLKIKLQILQKLGVPTGTLPDGSPNIMNFYMKAIHKGAHKEKTENGVTDSATFGPNGVSFTYSKDI